MVEQGPSAYAKHPKNRSQTEELWKRFCSSEDLRAPGLSTYEAMLVEDWERCRELGLDIEQGKATVVSDDEFQTLLEANGSLLERSRPLLDRILTGLAGVPGIFIVSDAEGTILYVAGDSQVRSEAAVLSNLREGGRFSEAVAGTNGIGTSIAKRAPVHISFSEHYLKAAHRWSCAAAPIFDPITGAIVGSVDFTTDRDGYEAIMVDIVSSAATRVTADLRTQGALEKIHLVDQFFLHGSRYPSEGVIVVDRGGHVLRSSAQEHPPGSVLRDEDEVAGSLREVHAVSMPGTKAPIGKVVVASRPRSAL